MVQTPYNDPSVVVLRGFYFLKNNYGKNDKLSISIHRDFVKYAEHKLYYWSNEQREVNFGRTKTLEMVG